MTFSDLDDYLRAHKDPELFILAQHATPDKPLQSYWPEHDPDQVMTMAEHYAIPHGESITFSQHARYAPVAEHRHAFIELTYVYSGTCRHTINGRQIELKAGDFCLLDTNVAHAIDYTGKDDIIINCLMRKAYFDVSLLSRLSGNDLLTHFFIQTIYENKNAQQYILFRGGGNANLQHIFKSMICEYFDPGLCSREVIDAYMIIVFSELLRTYRHAPDGQGIRSTKQDLVSDILLYLYNNHRQTSLSQTAQAFNLNPSYLSRMLKQSVGKGYMEILHELKLEEFCLLLKTTDRPIESIAQEIGYANMHYLYGLFQKHYKTTPAAYRLNTTIP